MKYNYVGKVRKNGVKDLMRRMLIGAVITALILPTVTPKTVNAAGSFYFSQSSSVTAPVIKTGDRVLVKREEESAESVPLNFYEDDEKTADTGIVDITDLIEDNVRDLSDKDTTGSLSEQLNRIMYGFGLGRGWNPTTNDVPDIKSKSDILTSDDFSESDDGDTFENRDILSLSSSEEKKVTEDIYVIKASKNDLNRMKKDPSLIEMEKDSEIYALGSYKASDLDDTVKDNSWAYKLVNADGLNLELMNGRGLKIAVLDTVVNRSYVDVKEEISFISDDIPDTDRILHGTYVANIIQKTVPGAEIYSAAILDKNGKGYYSTLIAGLKWAVSKKADIVVMSLGGEGYSNILRDEILDAYYHDTVIVCAAGNSGKFLYPAAFEETVSVGTVDKNKGIRYKYKDTRNKTIYADVYAPEDVYGLNGTSSSAAFVAGCTGVLLSYNFDLSTEQVRALYVNTGKTKERAYSVLDMGLAVTSSRNPVYTRLSYIDQKFDDLMEANDAID